MSVRVLVAGDQEIVRLGLRLALGAAADVEVVGEAADGEAALLGAGRSSARIAADLFVEESTVKTHVHRILRKLGPRNRTGAAVAAHRAGLLERE